MRERETVGRAARKDGAVLLRRRKACRQLLGPGLPGDCVNQV